MCVSYTDTSPSATFIQTRGLDVEAGRASGVHSTPTWFFNGVLWDGHYDHATLLEQANLALGAVK